MPNPTYTFPHQRLQAYRSGLELAQSCLKIAGQLPRGYGHIADHLRRSATAVPMLVGEGANRRTPAQKRQRFTEALGECGEVAAALELVQLLGLEGSQDFDETWGLCCRVHALLWGLAKR